MLTSFSLTQLILISVAYLSTLFGIAWITERGYVPRRLVRHPLVYTLSLGVYASAWAFYGTVGLAYQYGYGFLAIYLGISGCSAARNSSTCCAINPTRRAFQWWKR
ncbi:hypothetical protein N0701_31745, partial [Pseudomonas aeruginosa]|nr:hypothetical protein [Pseudomonas aeruginosa]